MSMMHSFTTQMISSTGVAANFSSSSISIERYFGYSVQYVWTGGVNGTAAILCSNDGVNFDTVSGSTQSLTGGGAGNSTSAAHFMNNFQQGQFYKYVQFQWTASTASSTGTVAAWLVAKGT